MNPEGGDPMFWNPRQLLDYWLADMSRAADGYLRSPLFLGWMRYAASMMRHAQGMVSWAPVGARLASAGPHPEEEPQAAPPRADGGAD
jgi:hypothetical protein